MTYKQAQQLGGNELGACP
ncbi:hypothetical protein [Rhizobium sp. K1/93]